MSGDHADQTLTANDTDIPQIDMNDHMATFDAFIGLTKWSMAAIAVLLFAMLIFLV